MSVLDIVPIISCPTCIPDINNSFAFRCGAFSWISVIAATIDTLTSITAPRDDINIPAYNMSETCNLELLAIYIIDSTSVILKPFKCDILPAIIASPPDIIIPVDVPIIAHIVFDEKPLSMYIEAARITIDVISAANTPLRPA